MKYYKTGKESAREVSSAPKKRNLMTIKASKKATIKDYIEISNNKKLKICIIRRLGGIGDILMITPLLKEIKSQYPDCELTFAIDMVSTNNYFLLVKNNPYIDHIVEASKCNVDKYDLYKDITSVCLQYENSGAATLNRIDIFASACGFKLKDKLPYYKVEEEEREWAIDFVNKTNPNKLRTIMLHTASFDHKRTWPIEKYLELISYLNKFGSFHYYVNDFQSYYKHWDSIKEVTNISPFNIRSVGAITEQMTLFIGPDSGPLHIAGSLKIPGIGIFSSIPTQARLNHYPSFTGIVHGGLSCQPCWYKTCHFNVKCMTNLSSDKVGQLALDKLNALL